MKFKLVCTMDPQEKATLEQITESLRSHLDTQHKIMNESFEQYEKAKYSRELRAKEFVSNKNSEELKIYLANQPVAYNLWKDADYDELIKLALEVFDE